MWTDEYISTQLLDIHLNPDTELASRNPESIQQTIDWMLHQLPDKKLKILDLGCGPGLYTEELCRRGHQITGVDFSTNSIRYARQSAAEKGLDITYIQDDYIALDLHAECYDLVILIYTDFGVLLPENRMTLLKKIHHWLKPGGYYFFDVQSDNYLKEYQTPKTWNVAEKGFWKNSPYLILSDSWLYENEKVILSQHVVLDEQERIETYRFWTHFFSERDLIQLLENAGFTNIRCATNIFSQADEKSEDEVIFCTGEKSK